MIIDCHVHIPKSRMESFAYMDVPAPEFVAALASRDIRRALVFPFDALWNAQDYSEANDELAGFCSQAPETLVPFGSVNPRDGRRALDELVRMVQDLRFRGIKLHPWIQSFSFLGGYMDPFLQEVRRLRVPIISHDGTSPYCAPSQIGSQAGRFPDITFVLGHAGLKDCWWEALQVALDHPNVVLSVNVPSLALQHMVNRLNGARIVFGSDYPFGGESVVDYWLGIVRQLPVPDSQKEAILCRNAQAIFGL
ncbi:MAG: amidohydrolase family protein [Anaerolineae bacterium]